MGFLLPAIVVVILDQATKQILWHIGKSFDVIDGILRITLVKNTGAAFGMFQGYRAFFIVASILASIFIIYVGFRTPFKNTVKRLMLGLILGGAVGNLIDRLFAGEVIDFIDMGIGVYRWPVYNVADIAVTVGAVCLILAFMRRSDRAIGHAAGRKAEPNGELRGGMNE